MLKGDASGRVMSGVLIDPAKTPYLGQYTLWDIMILFSLFQTGYLDIVEFSKQTPQRRTAVFRKWFEFFSL